MIKLLELSFENIGRFSTRQTIDFRNREKLIQVDGQNRNTGGSSGAAKSTVFKALGYLLDIGKTASTILQSRLTKNPLLVEGLFEINGQEVFISRSRKNGLTIKIGEETISGNVALAEERLESLIGIPKDLFGKMVHKHQKEGGFFLKMKASESYKFLIKLLGLEEWTNKITYIEEDVKKLQKELLLVDNDILVSKSMVLQSQSLLETVSPPKEVEDTNELELEYQGEIDTLELQKSSLETRESELQESIVRLSSSTPKLELPLYVEPNLDLYKQDLTKHQSSLNELLQQKTMLEQEGVRFQGEIEREIRTQEQALVQIQYSTKELDTIKSQIIALNEEKKHLELSKCPTCTQIWLGDELSAKITHTNDMILTLAKQGQLKKSDIDKKASIEENLSLNKNTLQLKKEESQLKISQISLAIDTQRNFVQVATTTLANISNEFRSKYDLSNLELKNTHQEKINTINQELLRISNDIKNIQANKFEVAQKISSIKEKTNMLLAKKEAYKREEQDYKNKTNSLRQSIIDKQSQIDEVENTIAQLNKKIVIAEESKRVIKNYTLQIFQESLDYIGEQASVIVAKIPNMSNASIYFEGCKETKSGNLKDEINAILVLDGENDVPIKSLSGGEETAIELAVDLAVIEMIEHKVGKGADFFILDEPFDGLDSISKEQCLDLLQGLDTNKKIIIVDHSAELKAMVNDVILVIRDGEESYINNVV